MLTFIILKKKKNENKRTNRNANGALVSLVVL